MRHLWREARGQRRPLVFFVLCLAVGVAAVVAVAGFSEGLDRGIQREARQMLAADLSVRGRHPVPEEIHRAVDAINAAQRTEIRELITLVAAPKEGAVGSSLLVEIKALGGTYPFYGEVEFGEVLPELAGTLRPDDLGGSLGAAHHAAVAPEVLSRLGLGLGDTLRIGGEPFRIVATVLREPDRIAGAFALGPRVFVTTEGLDRTTLEQLGSRITYRTLVALPPDDTLDVESVAETLRQTLPDSLRHRVETWRQAQPALRRSLERSERYLGLAALLSLLLGGIGVAQTVRAWIAGRLNAIAVLKCLGYRPRQVLRLYLGQTVAMALVGSALGVVLGVTLQGVAAQVLRGVLPVEYLDPWQAGAMARGLLLGVGVSLLFAWPPLEAAQRTPPIRVLRRDAEPPTAGQSAQRLQWATLLLGVFALATWQAKAWFEGALFTVGLVLATAALWGASRLLLAQTQRWRAGAVGPSKLWLRQGLAALERPGSGTLGAIVALGLGVLVVLTMWLVERRLSHQLDRDVPTEAPTAFLIDIQPDQWADVRALLEEQGAEDIDSVPMVMARLTTVDGRTAEEMAEAIGREGGDANWALRREQRLTYLETLPEGNAVIDGTLWSDPNLDELSVEEEYAELLGIRLGSRLLFDIQGVELELTVTSLRRVDWGTFGINYYLIVEPGVLEDAPQSRVAAVRLPEAADQVTQDALAAGFPNVTAIRLRDVLGRVTTMLGRVGLGVRLLGLLTVFAGLAILSGAVSASASRRGREVALLKTLGMTRRQVAAAFAVEFGLVGTVAGVVGTVAGTAIAWGVTTHGMDIPWSLDLPAILVTLGMAVALSVGAGLAASGNALRQRPVETLRHME